MGNCLRRQQGWGGEDWEESVGCRSSQRRHAATSRNGPESGSGLLTEKERLLGQSIDCSGNGKRMVKIKISRKELEELMGVDGLSIDQVLARLDGGDNPGGYMHRQGSWRPALQSIPEMD